MSGLKMLGITMENLIQLCVDSFRDPDSNRFEDVARFDNDETRIRADQRRRLVQVEQFMNNKGVVTFPRY
jgi:predicted nucleotidyltransferase